jgi:hypothetical protein
MQVSLPEYSTYTRLLNNRDVWGESGLFLWKNQAFYLYDDGRNDDEPLSCYPTGAFSPGVTYWLAFTRSRTAYTDDMGVVSWIVTVTLYVDGQQCDKATLVPGDNSGFGIQNDHPIDLMKDDGDEDSAGIMKRIRIFDRALSAQEIVDVVWFLNP